MDKYIDLIEMLPDDLRKHFEKGNCRYCGFQNATADYCKFRISWTFRDRRHNACGFTGFNFHDTRKSDCRFFVDLMKSEYNYN